MDWTTVEGLITSLGFPIVALIGVGWYFKGYMNRMMDENKEREADYRLILKEQNKLTDQSNLNMYGLISRMDEARQEHKQIMEGLSKICDRAEK